MADETAGVAVRPLSPSHRRDTEQIDIAFARQFDDLARGIVDTNRTKRRTIERRHRASEPPNRSALRADGIGTDPDTGARSRSISPE